MARLISYKVKDDSQYSTFANDTGNTGSHLMDAESESKSAWVCSICTCCQFGSRETVSEDIDHYLPQMKMIQVF